MGLIPALLMHRCNILAARISLCLLLYFIASVMINLGSCSYITIMYLFLLESSMVDCYVWLDPTFPIFSIFLTKAQVTQASPSMGLDNVISNEDSVLEGTLGLLVDLRISGII